MNLRVKGLKVRSGGQKHLDAFASSFLGDTGVGVGARSIRRARIKPAGEHVQCACAPPSSDPAARDEARRGAETRSGSSRAVTRSSTARWTCMIVGEAGEQAHLVAGEGVDPLLALPDLLAG